MPRHVTLQDDTQFATVYTDEAETDILYTLHRRQACESKEIPIWKVYDHDGHHVRSFKRTAWLCNWLIHPCHARIDHRAIDTDIIAAISEI